MVWVYVVRGMWPLKYVIEGRTTTDTWCLSCFIIVFVMCCVIALLFIFGVVFCYIVLQGAGYFGYSGM